MPATIDLEGDTHDIFTAYQRDDENHCQPVSGSAHHNTWSFHRSANGSVGSSGVASILTVVVGSTLIVSCSDSDGLESVSRSNFMSYIFE
ncbi:hypothetical protein SAMN05192552_10665 [Natrinema hispanicum]|uniref:Uncharacterized protein n=1 Tax=Natrinema hispanicum TaxID=392421 RepID=A0A1G6YI72_9EURY|nr:hypothetical protein SAMN05192552_10665 [Natrinema hispanicum]